MASDHMGCPQGHHHGHHLDASGSSSGSSSCSSLGTAWLTQNGHLVLEVGQHQVRNIVFIMIMVIVVFIVVPLPRILRGQDNNREAGGTDLPNLHTGEDDDDDIIVDGDIHNRLVQHTSPSLKH